MNFLLTPILYYVVDKYSIYHPHIENQYIFTYSPQSPYGTGCCYHPAPHLDRNCLDLFIIICLAIAVITFLHNRMMTVVEITMRPVGFVSYSFLPKSHMIHEHCYLWFMRCVEPAHKLSNLWRVGRLPIWVLEPIPTENWIFRESKLYGRIYVNCIMQLWACGTENFYQQPFPQCYWFSVPDIHNI